MTTLQMPRQPRRRAHRNQPHTVVMFLPASVPVLQRPPLAGLRFSAQQGALVTAALLARSRS